MICLALVGCGGAEPVPVGKDAPIVPVTSGAPGAAAPSTDTAWTVTPRGIGPGAGGDVDLRGAGVEVSGNAAAKESCEYVQAGRLPRASG
jgi:hypothetical protein